MKFLWLGFAAVLFWSGSAFAQPALQFDLNYPILGITGRASFEITPQVHVEAFMDLQLSEPQEVEVELFMPDMGHGSKATEVVETAPGQYKVSSMYFLMGGLWEVRVKLTARDGTSETQLFSLEFDPATGACTSRH